MFHTRGSSIEAPGAGSVAWVAKGNWIIFDFIYLCPSTVPCLRGRLVRPTTRQFQKLHVVPDVPHDLEHVAMPDITVHLLLDPREGHLRLGGKEGAILVSALPRRDFEDRLPVLRYLAKHPDRRRFQLVLFELVLERRGARFLLFCIW